MCCYAVLLLLFCSFFISFYNTACWVLSLPVVSTLPSLCVACGAYLCWGRNLQSCLQVQSNALAALEALDARVAEEVLAEGCITGDRVNGLVDGVSGKWCVLGPCVALLCHRIGFKGGEAFVQPLRICPLPSSLPLWVLKGEQEAVCTALGHKARPTGALGSLGSHVLKLESGHQ